MLRDQPVTLETAGLILRPLRPEHAAAFWEVLRHPEMYEWINRAAPQSPADVEARFARIAECIAPGRDAQWLNWTVWRREDEAPLGIVEVTVPPFNALEVAYMFSPSVWGQGYAFEAMQAALVALSQSGAVSFKATIDTRNTRSRALLQRLGFLWSETRAAQNEEIWWLTRIDHTFLQRA